MQNINQRLLHRAQQCLSNSMKPLQDPRSASHFCDSCCTMEFINSSEAAKSCKKECGKGSKAAALVCDEVGKMSEACAGSKQKRQSE